MNRCRYIAIFVLLLGLSYTRSPNLEEIGVEQVFLTQDQALKEVFPEASRFELDTKEVSEKVQKEIEENNIGPLESSQMVFHLAKAVDGKLLGYGIVVNQQGKYRPITQLVGITPDFQVKDVAIMIYRESRGADVRRKRFLNQFKKKSIKDPLQVNRDIINISGATISAHSVSIAVRRVLFLANRLYQPNQPKKP